MRSGAVNNSGMSGRLIKAADQVVSQWAGGESRQLAIEPAGSSLAARDFSWRFSSAIVRQDGAFSDFTGYWRYLAVREGGGLALQVDAQQIRLQSQLQLASFAGHARASGFLPAGPVRDLNLIHDHHWQGGFCPVQLRAGQWQQVAFASATQLLIYADGVANSELQVRQAGQHWSLQSGDLLIAEGNSAELCASTDLTLMLAWLAPVISR